MEDSVFSETQASDTHYDINIVQLINHLYRNTDICKTKKEIDLLCLNMAMKVLKSKFYCISLIDSNGSLYKIEGHEGAEIDRQKRKKYNQICHIHALKVIKTGELIIKTQKDMEKLNDDAILTLPLVDDNKIIGALTLIDGEYDGNSVDLMMAVSETISNVIVRWRTHAIMRENVCLMQTVMDSTSDFVFIKDRDSKVVMVNKAYGKIFNVDIRDVIGKDDYDLYPNPEMAKGVIENDRLVMEKGITQIVDESAMTSEGFKLTLLLRNHGWIQVERIGVLGIAHDITDHIQIQRALQESENRAHELVKDLQKADKNKNHFLNALSHELRNPLAAIVAGISILDVSKDTNLTIKAIETIKRQIDHLCKIVDNLLDLTRIKEIQIKLKKERIYINKLILEVVEDYRAIFEKKGVCVLTDTPSKPLYLHADSVRLTQTIGNLLHNALKYTQIGGTIVISLSEYEGNIIISVKDNGIGVNPDHLMKMFDPFIQVDDPIDSHLDGLGLGLAIVKEIILLHGGEVCAKSEGIGTGTEFIITIPHENVH